MADLSQYSTQPQPALQDYAIPQDAAAPVYSKNSTAALAAKSAAISSQPDQIMADYQSIQAETSLVGQSATAQKLQDDAKQNHMAANKAALVHVLADPNVPDTVKSVALNKVYNENSDLYDADRMLATSALDAPVQNENHEQEQVRVNVAGALDEVRNVRYQQQQLLNQQIILHDAPTGSKVVDFLSTLVPFNNQLKVAQQNAAVNPNAPVSSFLKGLVAPGSAEKDIRDGLEALPPSQRLEATQKLIDIVNQHSGITSQTNNDLSAINYMQKYITDGGVSNADEWVDNAAAVLDMVGVGSPLIKGAQKAASASKAGAAEAAFTKGAEDLGAAVRAKAADMASDATRDYTRSTSQPWSFSNTLKDTNVDKYRNAFDVAANDATGSAAQATHGTNQVDAVVDDLAPQAGHIDGSVNAKPGDANANDIAREAPPAELTEFLNHDGANEYFQSEKAAARSRVVNDFQQAFGTGSRNEMYQVHDITSEDVASGANIKAVIGPPVSGFTSAQDAIDMAKWALRDYGIADKDITLLQRVGSQYVPTTLENLTKAQTEALSSGKQVAGLNDYMLQVDYNYRFTPEEMSDSWAQPMVKGNFFDRGVVTSGKAGTFTSHVLDAASTLDPIIVRSAVTATDKSARLEQILLQQASDFGEEFKKLPVERRQLLEKLIKTANESGINLPEAKLQAMGLSDAERGTYKKFRQYWDTNFHLENRAYGNKLRKEGFKEFVHNEADTKLFVKEVGVNSIPYGTKFYNPLTDAIENVRESDLVDLYNKGGTAARVKRPITIGNQTAEHILVANDPKGGYLRSITDHTDVLNYRPGYYKVLYKDPHFIDEVTRDGAGKVIGSKAVATAPTIKQADTMVNRLSAANGKEYVRRYGREFTSDQRSEHEWDLHVSGGRSAQRVRGKRLEDAVSNIVNPEQTNVQNPVEAMVGAARNISRYTALSNWFDATGSRILDNYGHLLPKNDFGSAIIPDDLRDIKYRGEGSYNAKEIADARTSVNYFNYMQRGYVNAIDDATKAGLKIVSDALGNAGLEFAEKATRNLAEGKGLTNKAKGLSYQLYIALNPLRQFVVQAHQSVLLTALNPAWSLSGRGINQMMYMAGKQIGFDNMPAHLVKYFEFTTGKDQATLDNMFKAFKMSGQVAAIDKHALVKGALMDMADKLVATTSDDALQRFKRGAQVPFEITRKIGFDAGEYMNTVSSWLAHYDLAEKAGLNMKDASVLDDVAGKARNFTGNMNTAGDMPYNQNALGMIAQYQQNAHKLLLNMISNRGLSIGQKAALVAANLTLFGFGTHAAYSKWFAPVLNQVDDPTARSILADGLEATMINGTLSAATGEKVNIDFKGLAPLDMYGTFDFVHGIFTGSIGEVIASSPTGSMFMGSNPKVTNLATTAARYFNLIDDYQDPTTFGQVAMDVAKLSSGFSNFFKASYALKAGQKIGSTGKITDTSVPTAEAIAQAFGFQSKEEVMKAYLAGISSSDNKNMEDDIKKQYVSLRQHLSDSNIHPDQLDYVVRVHSEMYRVLGDEPRKNDILNRLLLQDVKTGNAPFYNSVMRQVGISDADTLKATYRNTPGVTPEQSNQANSVIDMIVNANKKQEK